MFAKINPNRTFAVLADYTNNKEKNARIIAHKDVCIVNNQAIADSFEAQASTNRRVKNPSKHISLSFSPHDAERITDEFMAQIAKEYMERMGIRNTQYIVVRHNDKDHPHCHIVYNRVDNNGKTISDSNDFQRSRKIAFNLTVRYGLYIASAKHDEEVKRYRLRGKDKTRYRIKDKVKEAYAVSRNWHEFKDELAKRNINMLLYYLKSKRIIQGISFSESDHHFSGAKLNFSYTQLCDSFGDVAQRLCQTTSQEIIDAAYAVAETATDVITIGLGAILELAFPPNQPSTSVNCGGGNSNNLDCSDDNKKRKKENYCRTHKFRR